MDFGSDFKCERKGMFTQRFFNVEWMRRSFQRMVLSTPGKATDFRSVSVGNLVKIFRPHAPPCEHNLIVHILHSAADGT